jgi:nicotinamide mononucleotide transporter
VLNEQRVSLSDLWSGLLASSPVEFAGVITGIACVWLAARNSIWNFPTALISCGLYVIVFWEARLYSDMALQGVFIALAFYGWYQWLYGGPQSQELPVTRATARQWVWLNAVGLAYAVGVGYGLSRYTDAAIPYWDSSTTAISLVAQVLLTRKKLENWILWLVVDIAYIGLYWHRDLYLTAGLYAVYLVLAAYGYFEWRRLLRATLHPQVA